MTNAPVVNHPRRVAMTSRREIARRLRGIDGVRTPRIVPFDSHRPPERPYLLRALGFHMGQYFERIDDAQALSAALERFPPVELAAVEFIETRDDDGWYRKYRVMALDGKLYPLHLAASQSWKVHYFSSAMEEEAALREQEAVFLGDMAAAIGRPAVLALERVADELGLEYAGIDFALDSDGAVVVFEANAAMAVVPPGDDPRFTYRRAAADAVKGAMQALLDRRLR